MSSIGKESLPAIMAMIDQGEYRKVVEILEYENIFNGGLTYKLIESGDDADRIKATIACRSWRVYWRRT